MVNLTSNHYPQSTRSNLPTDQTEQFMDDKDKDEVVFVPEPLPGSYPIMQWERGAMKDEDFQHGLLYTHEKIQPHALIQSIMKDNSVYKQADMFAQFNGLPENAAFEWYQHKGHWQNRLIHGDAKRVMSSIAGREGLSGQVQMIYIDPPYNINFKSNFQLQVDKTETSEKAKDKDMPHDPKSIKAFRDKYNNRVHSYLDDLYWQLILARSLLADSGSCFVQMGPDNVHPIAMLMAEVFGYENHVATIPYVTSFNQSSKFIPVVNNWVIWFAKDESKAKRHHIYTDTSLKGKIDNMWNPRVELKEGTVRNILEEEFNDPKKLPKDAKVWDQRPLQSQHYSNTNTFSFEYEGISYPCLDTRHWRVSKQGLLRLGEKGRLNTGNPNSLTWKRYTEDMPGKRLTGVWLDGGRVSDKRYIVQTPTTVIERCMLMTTDPGDLVLDPTCGSGTTAYVAERWGRRWITIDSSRVAIAVARQRLTTSMYDYHMLQDTESGARRESELSGNPYVQPSGNKDVARGFVYKRVPRVSAATLAYDLREHILLVDQPEIERKGKIRVCSPFTVESDSPSIAMPIGDELTHITENENLTYQRILEALPITGISYRGGDLQISNMEECPRNRVISHTAILTESKSEYFRAALYIAPEDSVVSKSILRRAAEESVNLIPRVDALVVLAFAYEASVTDKEYENMGRMRIIRVEINKDLTIPGLEHSPNDNAFVIIGEPQVDFHHTKEGELELEVLGIDTYDPARRYVRPGSAKDIHCIMTDTDYDGLSFYARRINFPNQTKDRQLNRIKSRLERHIDEEYWGRMLSTTTIPFGHPKDGRIAVKVIDRSGMETMRVLNVSDIIGTGNETK